MDPDEFADTLETVFAGIPNTTLTDEQREQLRERLAAGAAGEFFGLQASGSPAPSGVAAVARGRRSIARNPEAAVATRGGNRVLLASSPGTWIEDRPVTDRYELAEHLCRVLRAQDRHGPAKGRVLCASAFWDYPEDRILTGDPSADARKLDAAVGLQALTASGGICLPTNVDYEVRTWATAERPLKEGLPAFDASRGGLIYPEPPSIGTLAAAVGIWSEATDAEPLAATKPVYSISCGSVIQVFTSAVTVRVGMGNMMARFAPETIAANTDLAQAEWARKAEINLLEGIRAKALADVTQAKVLGATRDIITSINSVAANFRATNRLPRDVALTAVFPSWLLDLLKIDIARETAHSENSDWNSLAVTDEMVIDTLKAHGINPIFTLDYLPVSGGIPAQTFTVQSASSAMTSFPSKTVWFMFPEGAIQFLDGGRLDLGVVRDSTLDATNDAEIFWESFEAIADRGFSKSVIEVVSELCGNGTSAATATVSGCP